MEKERLEPVYLLYWFGPTRNAPENSYLSAQCHGDTAIYRIPVGAIDCKLLTVLDQLSFAFDRDRPLMCSYINAVRDSMPSEWNVAPRAGDPAPPERFSVFQTWMVTCDHTPEELTRKCVSASLRDLYALKAISALVLVSNGRGLSSPSDSPENEASEGVESCHGDSPCCRWTNPESNAFPRWKFVNEFDASEDKVS